MPVLSLMPPFPPRSIQPVGWREALRAMLRRVFARRRRVEFKRIVTPVLSKDMRAVYREDIRKILTADSLKQPHVLVGPVYRLRKSDIVRGMYDGPMKVAVTNTDIRKILRELAAYDAAAYDAGYDAGTGRGGRR